MHPVYVRIVWILSCAICFVCIVWIISCATCFVPLYSLHTFDFVDNHLPWFVPNLCVMHQPTDLWLHLWLTALQTWNVPPSSSSQETFVVCACFVDCVLCCVHYVLFVGIQTSVFDENHHPYCPHFGTKALCAPCFMQLNYDFDSWVPPTYHWPLPPSRNLKCTSIIKDRHHYHLDPSPFRTGLSIVLCGYPLVKVPVEFLPLLPFSWVLFFFRIKWGILGAQMTNVHLGSMHIGWSVRFLRIRFSSTFVQTLIEAP